MNSFFKLIGLYEELSFHAMMDKAEFIKKLEKHIYKSDFSIFEAADFSIPNRFEYKGYVNKNGFLIRRRRYFFDNNIQNPNIKGTISDENGKVLITMEFKPVWYSILSFFFLLIFVIIFLNIDMQRNPDMLFIMLIPLVVILTHYFTLRRNIKKAKYDFERELNFIVQKNDQFHK